MLDVGFGWEKFSLSLHGVVGRFFYLVYAVIGHHTQLLHPLSWHCQYGHRILFHICYYIPLFLSSVSMYSL